MIPQVLAFGLALLASGLLTFPVCLVASRLGIVDRPNSRSSHVVSTPRAGGVAILLAIALSSFWLVSPSRDVVVGASCVAAVAAVSLLDDLASLSFLTRLVVQTTAAAVAVGVLDLPVRALELPWASVGLPHVCGLALAVLWTVAYTNFFNFMDGINGLAVGQAVLSAATLAVWLGAGGSASGAVVAAAVSGASAGFLPHNYPRARVFMGDVGSATLGFTLALLSQAAHTRAGIPWVMVLMPHAVFLFDAIVTIVKRLARRENIVKPHREHNYQLLVRSGWSHGSATLLFWALSSGCCLVALVSTRLGGPERWAGPVLTLVVLASVAVWIHRRAPRNKPAAVVQSVARGSLG